MPVPIARDTILAALTDSEVFSLTMLGEVRGEPIAGWIAFGAVVRNRTTATQRTYKEVCLDPGDFSCWNPGNDANAQWLLGLAQILSVGDSLRLEEAVLYRRAGFLVAGLLDGILPDETHGARWYLTGALYNLKPGALAPVATGARRRYGSEWMYSRRGVLLTPCARIGRHVFFNNVED